MNQSQFVHSGKNDLNLKNQQFNFYVMHPQ